MPVWAAVVPWGGVAHLCGKLCLPPSLSCCVWNGIAVFYSLLFLRHIHQISASALNFPINNLLRLNTYASRKEEENILFLVLYHRGS